MTPLALRTSLIIILLFSAGKLNVGSAGGEIGLTHIGTQKQFFIDDYIVEQMSHVKRVLNHGVKARNNPVVRADRPWQPTICVSTRLSTTTKMVCSRCGTAPRTSSSPRKSLERGIEWNGHSGGIASQE